MSSYRLDIWDEAEEELREAISWYESELEGLGEDLYLEVQRALSLVQESPLQYQLVHKQLRKAVVSRFPYSVIYRIRDDVIQVVAIMHQSRRPERWMERR